MTTTTIVRRSDPRTSRDAAERVQPLRSNKQAIVLELLCDHFAKTGDGLHDGELEDLPPVNTWKVTSGRCRRRDLRDAGHVKDSGRQREGRIVWVPNLSSPLVRRMLGRPAETLF